MEKLYEENPFLARFTAQVRSCAQGRKGWDVILDQTAFYPEGAASPMTWVPWAGSRCWRSTSGRAMWSTPAPPLWRRGAPWRGRSTGPAAST